MPPRLVCVAILLFWVVAASNLIRRDVLPELGFVRPPDLRTIATVEADAGPSHWSVEVIDNPLSPESRRTIGHAETSSIRDSNGWLVTSSRVTFGAGGLLKGTPFAQNADEQLAVLSRYHIDPSGNLRTFDVLVKSASDPEELLQVEGRLKDRTFEIVSRGRLPILNQTRSFPYAPRGLVQNSLSPFDRLPNLQVGQRWETRMVSPLTGRVETARVEVTRRCMIHWENGPVSTFEVVHHVAPLSAKTWVRPDGLVLRQEVPFPFVKLVLERIPDRVDTKDASGTAR